VTPSTFDESLLILSDVHLGNDLNDVMRDGARRSMRVDADLASLLWHYRRAPASGRRWRLVIAGDFIDFIGMAILPRAGELETAPNAEEREHGLGNSAAHGRLKLRAVAARHAVVFDALAAFVADGHALTIVHGNHDVEFHWDVIKEDLRAHLLEIAVRGHGADAERAGEFAARIEFAPWFYYVGGVAYVEHGHQYDTLCSSAHVMSPISPLDPRSIARSFSDVLLRWVVRPTRGVPEYGHHSMGLVDYVLLGARMGTVGLVRLAGRFAGAVRELFRLRRASLSSAARALHEEHERRMTALADATRVGIERLQALVALQAPPVTQSVSKILASVLLDRLALGVAAAVAIVAIAASGAHGGWRWPVIALVGVAWTLAHLYLRAQRRAWFGARLDNDEALVERAGHLAHLFPAAFVVMGHTHTPAMVPVAEGASTYVNVGSWHEPESDAEDTTSYRAARTHLVIHPAVSPSGVTAEFLAWSPDGPRRFLGGLLPERTS
jgi:UDP-2,3-diacylglucosamine pyrophosphatase LpxH